MSNDADVIIVGAGPIGIELAIALKQAGISYLQFDKGQVAQMVFNYPLETPFFSSSERISIAGIPIQVNSQQKCSRENYLAYMRSVVMAHHLKVNTNEDVINIKKENGGFVVLTNLKSYRVRFVVIATGSTSYPRLLGVEGENLPHVAIQMRDPHKYFEKKVLVIGGRNSAADSALRLYQVGAHVTMAVRAQAFNPNDIKYWILPELQGRISHGEIHCFFDTGVLEILKDRVILQRGKETFDVEVDYVIKCIGFLADMSLCEQLGVNLLAEQKRPQFDPETMETNVPGVFVAGTVIGGTQNKYRIFIENSHEHVLKILKKLCGKLGLHVPHVAIGNGREAYVPSVKLEE